MKQLFGVLAVLGACVSPALAADPLPKPLVTGLKSPLFTAVGADGRVYVAVSGENDKYDIVVLEDGKTKPFATGLEAVGGMVAFRDGLFVTSGKTIRRIDRGGRVQTYVADTAFPNLPNILSGLAIDEAGILYTASSVEKDNQAIVYRIDPPKPFTRPPTPQVSAMIDSKKTHELRLPTALKMDGMSFLVFADGSTGEIQRVKLADGSATKIADGFKHPSDLAWDHNGRLYVSEESTGKLFVVPRPGDKPVLYAEGFGGSPLLGLDASGNSILVTDRKAGTITALPTKVPGHDIDETPLNLDISVAFPDLKWKGWEPETKTGKKNLFRPIVLTHAGDGSDRVFVATEQGVIHVFPNDQKATDTQIFLDIQDRVVYNDKQNEEGFLGLAFHPKYKTNGEFFVFYTSKKDKLTNIISRFHVSKDDPNKADPGSEEVLLRIEKPFWNHDGGTLCFGPDGYLYFTHGDGGLANDPQKNGQKLSTLLGKILRIDVDHKENGKNYAIPKDNPFVDRKEAAGEIWAYGLRNVWRMSFDRKTGMLWAGDVGQNLYEEIDLIVKGGNYGWSLREGLHPFSDDGVRENKEIIEPIWEYDHDVGKCIIGGHVYRGKRLPELDGSYLYADYVSGKLWALRYDDAKKRVVANRPIAAKGFPILSFGEDEKGEVYFLEETATGKGIHWYVKPKEGK